MIWLSFAMALPSDHPEQQEGSPTRRTFEAFREVLDSGAYSDNWQVRYREAAMFDTVPSAIESMASQARSLRDQNPHDWLVHMLALPREQCSIDWMIRHLRVPENVILVPVIKEGTAVPAGSRIAALPPLDRQKIDTNYHLAMFTALTILNC